jgi:hypothetical protein
MMCHFVGLTSPAVLKVFALGAVWVRGGCSTLKIHKTLGSTRFCCTLAYLTLVVMTGCFFGKQVMPAQKACEVFVIV